MMRRMQAGNKARSDRWKREDEAPRLKEKVPTLKALRLELEEFAEGHAISGTRRIRHIVVDQAAALFEIPCSDTKCEEGGHDVTQLIMRELSQQKAAFANESGCAGYLGNHPCGRVLKFNAYAEYAEDAAAP